MAARVKVIAPTRRIEISSKELRSLVNGLAIRGEGRRESGAFILGRVSERPSDGKNWPVFQIVYYDDLDAECLTGGITFRGFRALWETCRQNKATVIADVHTHPGAWVQQSRTDASNPMIASIGHVAVIVPNYAQGRPPLAAFGMYSYQGDYKWQRRTDCILLIGPVRGAIRHFLRMLRRARSR